MDTALRAHQTFAFQRYLSEQISLEQMLVEKLPGRAAPLLHLSVVVARLRSRKSCWMYFQPHGLKAIVKCLKVEGLVEFFVEKQRNIGEEMATFSDLLLRGHQYSTTPQV